MRRRPRYAGIFDAIPGAMILSLTVIAGCQSSAGFLKTDSRANEEACRQGAAGRSGSEFLSDGQSAGGARVQQCRENGNGKECRRNDTIDRDAVPAPTGTYVNQWNDAMICAARQQHLIVSRHEWFSGGIELGPEGRDHVSQLAESLQYSSEQAVIELEPVQPDYDETLEEATSRTLQMNEQRRQAVIELMVESGMPDADQRVILRPLDPVGVRGLEAPRVYNSLLFGGQGGGQGGNQNGGGNMGAGQGNGGGGGFGGGGIF